MAKLFSGKVIAGPVSTPVTRKTGSVEQCSAQKKPRTQVPISSFCEKKPREQDTWQAAFGTPGAGSKLAFQV